jgi:uroporphyrinogen-III synthase
MILIFMFSSILICSALLINSPITSMCSKNNPIGVALTREFGENSKLSELLKHQPTINCLELPCIEFSSLPEADRLSINTHIYDVVIVTSPHAAKVVVKKMKSEITSKRLGVAAVGKGTSKILIDNGIVPDFEPSIATAQCLAEELPSKFHSALYPTSVLTSNALQNSLEKRGIKVQLQ